MDLLGDDRADVTDDKILTLADSQDERAASSRTEDHFRHVDMKESETVGANDLFQSEPKSVQQSLFVSRPDHAVKDKADQVCQYLRIGLRAKRVTLGQQLISQRLEILDHPIMDER